MVDQRKLPTREIYVSCRTAAEVARAIRTMVIRGAPAIGVRVLRCVQGPPPEAQVPADRGRPNHIDVVDGTGLIAAT